METRSASQRSVTGKRGSAVTMGTAALGLAVASALGVVAARPAVPVPKATALSLVPPAGASTEELRWVLNELGLTAENLAAAGVTAHDVSLVVRDAADGLAASREGLRGAQASFAGVRQAKDAMDRAVQSGQASPKDVAAYPSVLHACETGQARLRAARKGLWTRCTVRLSEQQRGMIEKIEANASWDVSTQYLVVNRTEPQWVQLRDAWAADRFARSQRHETPEAAAAVLSAADGDPAVLVAATNLGNLAAIKAAWLSATENAQP